MPSTYIGKKGELRIYESTDTPRAVGNVNVEVFDSSAGTFSDVTSAAHSASGSLTGAVNFDSGDFLYVGATEKFARIEVDVSTAAVGSGALSVAYYDGSSWTAVAELSDGTLSGSDTLAQDGVVSFKVPIDWTKQGNANLDSDKFYVRLSTASAPSTDPNFERVVPVDGLYLSVPFVEMDLSAPEGRARPEETLILDRGNLDSNAHYVQGLDDPILEPVEVSLSVRLYDTLTSGGALELGEALRCGDPEASTWNATGTSTKGDTELVSGDGTNVNAATFADGSSKKKTVAVQVVWTSLADATKKIGREYNEVWFDLSQQEIAEAEDGLTLSLTGTCYGTIREIADFAYQH